MSWCRPRRHRDPGQLGEPEFRPRWREMQKAGGRFIESCLLASGSATLRRCSNASPLSRFHKKRALVHPGLFSLEYRLLGIALVEQSNCLVSAAVAPAEERPEPIVQTNFEHLNFAARRESVSPERPRSKR